MTLSKLRTVLGKGFLAATMVRSTVCGRERRVGLTRTIKKVWRKHVLSLISKTAEIRKVKVSPIVIPGSARTEDQGFALATGKKDDGSRRRPGRLRKLEILATVASSNTKEKTPTISTT